MSGITNTVSTVSLSQILQTLRNSNISSDDGGSDDQPKSQKASATTTNLTGLGSPVDGNGLALLLNLQSSGVPATSSASDNSATGQDGFQQDVKALFSAVQAGDLDAAKAAYTKLSADQQAAGQTTGAGNTDGGPFGKLLDTIGAALDNNDIGTAQTALASAPHRGGHAHGGGSAGDDASTDASGSSETITLNADGTITITTTDADGNKTDVTEGEATDGSGQTTDTKQADGADDTNTSIEKLQSLMKQLQKVLASLENTTTAGTVEAGSV